MFSGQRKVSFSRAAHNGKWVQVQAYDDEAGLVKRHGLTGPIDDAFMDAFVMVRPTGKAANAKVGEWVEKEMKHAVDHWRKQFRGDARVKSDGELTDADIANSNLILWGDPKSNAVLAKVADKLPIKWTDKGVVVGKDTYDAATHAPVLIYPNPLNPEKYVVVNSGFTYREYDYLNNARQAPKLPDYAIIDTTTPPNARFPGKVVRGGFFGAEMVHPRFRVLKRPEPLPDALTPVYPTTAGLSQATLRGLIQSALDELLLDDTLEPGRLAALGLPGFRDSILTLHRPPPEIFTFCKQCGPRSRIVTEPRPCNASAQVMAPKKPAAPPPTTTTLGWCDGFMNYRGTDDTEAGFSSLCPLCLCGGRSRRKRLPLPPVMVTPLSSKPTRYSMFSVRPTPPPSSTVTSTPS